MRTKLLLIAALSLCLNACGIKPGQVDPPEEAKGERYPAHYPSTVSK